MIIFDMPYVQFKEYNKQNPVFFWTENETEFVLLKPHNDAWFRCIVKKGRNESDDLFRLNHLNVGYGIFIPKITGLDLNEKIDRLLQLEERERLRENSSRILDADVVSHE